MEYPTVRHRLVCTKGLNAGFSYALPLSTIAVAGTAPFANIHLRDPSAASVHFDARILDARPWIRAHAPLRVNGALFSDGVLVDGDTVGLGDSAFVLRTATLRARASTELLPPTAMTVERDATEASVARRLAQLRDQSGQQLYGILDLARSDAQRFVASMRAPRPIPLILTRGESDIAGSGPVLVALPDDAVVGELLQHARSESTAMIVASPFATTAVARQLRRLLVVRVDGRRTLFRFYDPLVLHRFLAACTQRELESVFGPIHAITLPTMLPDLWMTLTLDFHHRAADESPPNRNIHLELSEPQVRALRSLTADTTTLRIADFVCEHFPETRSLPDKLLFEMVRAGEDRARGHGLTWESSITAFVALMFEFSPNFDEHPRVAALLRDPLVDVNQRVRNLTRVVTHEVWREVRQMEDADAWMYADTHAPGESDVER